MTTHSHKCTCNCLHIHEGEDNHITNIILPHHHGSHSETILSHIPGDHEIQTIADALRQLGDSSRLRIFWLLCHCEECVINISAMVNMSSPAVSHHLKSLKDSGLIVSRRAGKEMYYRAADTELVSVLHPTIEAMARIQCPSSEHPVDASTETPLEQTLREIHDELVSHLDQRITIEELSRRHLINTSALKTGFKDMYGLPVAAYMKGYRIQEAARLLRETDETIAVIAKRVGYETQTKFTAAFKSVMQELPSDYRRLHT